MKFLVGLLLFLLFSTAIFSQVSKCKHREMDFWIGEWDVYSNASGNLIGGNKITSILGGCALREEWWDVRKFEGTSNTIYREKHKKQRWANDHQSNNDYQKIC